MNTVWGHQCPEHHCLFTCLGLSPGSTSEPSRHPSEATIMLFLFALRVFPPRSVVQGRPAGSLAQERTLPVPVTFPSVVLSVTYKATPPSQGLEHCVWCIPGRALKKGLTDLESCSAGAIVYRRGHHGKARTSRSERRPRDRTEVREGVCSHTYRLLRC